MTKEIYVARFRKHLLTKIVMGVFCNCAGYCTVSTNFRNSPLIPTPRLCHLNEFSSPLLIRTPPLIRDLRVDVILDIVFDAL